MKKLVAMNKETIGEMQQLQRWVPVSMLLRALTPSQREDVHALATLLNQPLALVVVLQFSYEALSLALLDGGACGCTAIMQDHADGVVHARTLDWAWLDGLHELLVDLSVTRGGELLYRSTTIAGFVGVLTAMRAGAGGAPAGGYSISLNYRRPFKGKWVDGEPEFDLPTLSRAGPLLAAVRQAIAGGWLVAGLLRHVVESAASFEDALRLLRKERVVAPCYVAVAGASAGQGALFTCGVGRERTEQKLADASRDGALCIANVDCFGEEVPPPIRTPPRPGPAEAKDFLHGESWLRRDLALRLARHHRTDSAAEAVPAFEHIIGAPPIANDVTIHHSVMCAATGAYVTARSAGPALLAACEFEPAAAVCRVCCSCNKKTAIYALKKRAAAAELVPGSLLRRRGGGYYCRACLPLSAEDLSARNESPSKSA